MRNICRALIVLTLGLGLPAVGFAQAPARNVQLPPKPSGQVGPFNFMPVVTEQNFDGFIAKVVVFKDGSTAMQVKLPTGWVAAGSSSEMYLTNPQLADGRITLRLSSLEAPTKFDDPWIEITKPLILGSLPKDSTEQRIANVTQNVLNIRGWTSIEFKASFDRLGRRLSTGWLFLRLPDRRMIEVIYTAPDDKFTQVRTAAFEMMQGWERHVIAVPKAGAR